MKTIRDFQTWIIGLLRDLEGETMTGCIDDTAGEWVADSSNDKSDENALRKHLESEHPHASSTEIDDTIACFIPHKPSPPKVIKKKATKKWYTKPKSSHLNFPTFYDKSLDLPKPAKNVIRKSSLEILNLLPDPKTMTKPVSGLVVGNVQSGKTANFTSLVARAADSGYNLIVILSGGNFNDLRAQTQLRMFKDLIDPVNAIKDVWHKATNADSTLRGDVGNDKNGWNPHWNPTTHPHCLVVTKKNSSTLPNLKDWIMDLKSKYEQPIKLLMIDDEADHASLNNFITKKKLTEEEKKDKKDASKINRSIRELLHEVPQHAYIGFTASPFANLFVPPDIDELEYQSVKIPTLYPRDFIYLLPEPKGYFGLNKLCQGDEAKWTNVLCKVLEEEAEFYRKHTETKPVSASLYSGLKSAVYDFIIALGLKYLRRKAKSVTDSNIVPRAFHHSMLVHTKETTDTMYGLTETIGPFVKELRNAIDESGTPPGLLMADVRELLEHFETHYKSAHAKFNAPKYTWKELIGALREYFDVSSTANFPEVKEISSAKNPDGTMRGENLEYVSGQPCAVIAIGGNRLARGFTLEGLSVSYFVREPSSGFKSDTLLQQGRWYGFRGGDEDLVRIYTTKSIRNELWDLKRVEQACHQKIQEFVDQNLPPSAYSVAVIKTANQSPTAETKIPFLRTREVPSLFSGDYLPKNGNSLPIRLGDPVSEKMLQDNYTQLGTFLDACNAYSGSSPAPVQNRYTWDNIPLATVRDYFDDTLDDFHDDFYEKKTLLNYLDERAKQSHGDCSNWTVVLVGRKPDSKNPEIPLKLGASTYNLCLVKRSRTDKTSNKVGYFTQTKHFAIGLPSQESSIQENCRKRDKNNPILLLYLFDKDSKGSGDRGDLNTKQHVVAPAIGFPTATELTSEEKKNLNVTIWENGKLKSTYVGA